MNLQTSIHAQMTAQIKEFVIQVMVLAYVMMDFLEKTVQKVQVKAKMPKWDFQAVESQKREICKPFLRHYKPLSISGHPPKISS